jgi:PAS domain S-box-containing protein
MNKYSILVVEDEALIAASLVHTLSSLGYTVHKPVATGEGAILAVKTQKPDLVLMDIELIGAMDGIETAEKIRAIADIPVIYLTAYADDKRLAKARLTEPYGYIVKPSHNRELKATIEMALYKHALDRKLKESEERYRTLVESTSDMIWEVNSDGRYSYVSPVIHALLGFEPEEVIGRTPFDLMPPDEAEKVRKVFSECIDSRKPIVRLENTNLHKDGHPVVLETSGEPTFDTSGNLTGYRGIDRDITERKRMEGVLRESEARFHEIFNKINDAIHLHEIGEDGRPGKFMDVNDVACQMLQYSRDEMLQYTPLDFATEYHSRPIDEIFEDLRTVGHAVFETGHKRKDGTIVPVEINAHKITLMGREVVLSVVRDITKRKMVEEALQESREFLNKIINSISDPIHVKDRQHRIILINDAACRLFNLSREEIIGKTAYELFAGKEMADISWQKDEEVFRKGKESVSEETNIYAPGKTLTVLVKKTLYTDTAKNHFLVGITTDITERKRAEEALRESEERFNLAIDGANLGLWDMNLLTGGMVHNRRWAEMLGFSTAELEKPSVWWGERVHPDDYQNVLNFSNLHRAGKVPLFDAVYRMKHKDGSWRWVHSQGKVVARDSDGRPLRMIGINQDITEHKRAEDALQDSEELFREVINNANDAIFLHEMTPEGPGKYILVNDPGIKSLGYSREEFLMMYPGDIVPKTIMEGLLPFTLPNMHKDGYATFESIHIRKDGSKYPVEVSTHTFPFKGRNVALSIVRDITERKRAGETEQQLTEFRESVITNARVWLSVLDLKGKILVWNTAAEEISGYRAEAVIGKNEIWKLLYPQKEYRTHITDTINRIIRDQKYLENFETTIRSKQGNQKVISWNTRGIADATGKILNYIAIGVDVTDRQMAEQMLRESEEKFRTVLENVPDLILVHRKGIILYINPPAKEIMGYPHDELINKQLTDFIVPEYHLLVAQAISRRMDGKTVEPYEIEILTKSGERRTVAVRGSLIEFAGSPASLNVLTDITERKLAEEALRESEEVLRSMLDATPAGVGLLVNRVLQKVNHSLCKITGYSEEEMIGQSTRMLYPDDEEFLRVGRELYERMEREGLGTVEARLKRKDGAPIIVMLSLSPFDPQNLTGGVTATVLDITDRKRAEVSLRETEERYRSLFDRSLDCVYIHDFEGNFIDANPSALKLLGYNGEEIMSVKFTSLLTAEQNPLALHVIQEVITTGTQTESSEYRVRRKDGTYIDVETTATLLYHEGKPYAIQGFAHDITERKKTEERLKKFNEELERGIAERTARINASLEEKVVLLREIHHRVRNNLQIILSLISLQSRNIKDQKVLDTMGEFQNRIMAMAHVHERMCRADDISRIDLSEIVTFLGTSLFKSYKVNPQHIRLNVEMQDLQITIDSAIPISLIINELVSNSIKHAFPKGTKGEITIAGHREADTLVFSIRDTGTGIPKDLDWMRSKQSLGFRLVVSLVEQLNGTIDLDQTTGTVFKIVVKERQ